MNNDLPMLTWRHFSISPAFRIYKRN